MEEVIILDIETSGLDAFSHRIIGYGLWKNNEILVRIDKDEKKLIQELWNEIENKIVVGYNIENFDIFFLRIRSLKHSIRVKNNFKVIDIMKVLGINGYKKRRSLNFVAEFLEIDSKEFSGAKIPELWEKGEYKKIEEYIRKEIEILYKIFEKLKECNILNEQYLLWL
ncbi:MAG: ribonuclease H-like domain-containing protein [Candidatus Aenigmatarchaeota archaeon]